MITEPGSPLDRLLTASLLVAPPVYLLADVLYAARGWSDPSAAVVHVLGAIAYAFVLLRVVTWTRGWFAVALLVVGVAGVAGNVAYGFDTVHVSLGHTALVDEAGAANLIKPLGLCFPITLLLCALPLRRAARPQAVLLGLAAPAWPVAHIANVAWLAVAVNVALVVALGTLPRTALVSPAASNRGRAVPAAAR
jgi:hypothetical protein